MARFVLKLSFALALVFLLAPTLTEAQITAITGDQAPPTPGAGHDYIRMLSETVSPATGAVSVRINVPVPPARGITVPFSFGYDSNAAFHRIPGHWTDNTAYLAQGGWSYVLPFLSVQPQVATYPHPGGGPPYFCHYATDYVFTDLQGGTHALGISPDQISVVNGPCVYVNGTGYWHPGDYLFGGDAKVQATTTQYASQVGGPAPQNPPPVTVSDGDGTVYSFSGLWQEIVVTGASGMAALPAAIEDRNGNKTVFSDSGSGRFTITDPLGRVALSSSGFGTSGNTVTVSGFTNPYTVNWGTSSPTNLLQTVEFTDLNPLNTGSCQLGTGVNPPYHEVTQIVLPNGRSYQFQYDPTSSMLSKLTYPSGGYVRYVWSANHPAEFSIWSKTPQTSGAPPAITPDCEEQHDSWAVQNRYVSFDGVHEVEEQDFTYFTDWIVCPHQGAPCLANGQKSWDYKQTTVVTKDLVRGTNFQTIYTYVPWGIAPTPNDHIWWGSQTTPVESQIAYHDIGGSLLQTVQKSFVDSQLLPNQTLTWAANSQTSQATYTYLSAWDPPPSNAGDMPANCTVATCLAVLTNENAYDYGTGAPGALLKNTHADYISLTTPIFPSAPSIVDRPSDIIVYDGLGNRMSETDYSYDQTSIGPVTATGHDDTNYGTASAIRGNLTTQTSKCFVGSTTCTDSTKTFLYDQTGQVLSKTDPCGNPPGACADVTGTNQTTTYSYADSYTILSSGQNIPYTPSGNTNAFLTSITDALGHTSSFMYDFNNGQLTKSTDPNTPPQSTTYLYNDPLARPTQINYPDTGQTEVTYNDTVPSPTVTTCQLISGTTGTTCSATSPASGWKTSLATLDGLGHVVQTKLVSDPDGATYAATTYDGLERPYQVYNPTRCNPPTSSCGETTWGYTTYTYDALGRTTQVAEPDGSVVSTAFSGNQTTVIDEVGNQRKTQTDGLGRLTAVWEAPNVSGMNYETDYSYDTLNNVLNVTQKGSATSGSWRIRTFTYDSLSRLLCAANPEIQIVTCPTNSMTFPVGAITYAYDLNGNLMTRIAPKANQISTAQTTTAYTYDVVNRLTQKTYTNPAGTARYGYDGISPTGCNVPLPAITSPTNLIGRRSDACWSLSSSRYSYDPMGRQLQEVRNNRGSSTAVKYPVSYSYFKDGSLHTLTYPSGDVLTYTVGDAGRVTYLSDPSNSYVGYTSNPAKYSPSGALTSMVNGHTSTLAGITTSNIYNDRLQPILFSAAVTPNPALFSLCYDFHLHVAINNAPCVISASTTGDNGNVLRILNNVDSTRSTTFAYDSLNRTSQANTITTTGTNCWGETYTIDAWGNLTNRGGVTGMTGCSTEPLNAAPASVKNQLPILTYDAAGNVRNDGNGNAPTYDVENRVSTDAGVNYYYDIDGVRTEKSPGGMYWPGLPGALTETDLVGTTINAEYIFFNGQRIARVDRPSGTVHYYFSDHLGSASVVSDASGGNPTRYYYYPYGGTQSTVGSEPNHYKFTGKERDTESGLDYFGARHYASTTGRWMSPDLVNVTEGRVVNPGNTLNKYVYGGNNPLKYVDPDGRDITYFYDQGGIAGHAILFAYNQATGDSAIESFGPEYHLPIAPGESMYEMSSFTSADDLRDKLTSLTIQTTPELTQQVIDYIRANPDPALWVYAGPNCSSQVWKILQKFKLAHKNSRLDGKPGNTPRNLWGNLIQQNNPFHQGLNPKKGVDYGNNRFDMFNLMWLSLPQSQPKATVTVTVTNCVTDENGKKTCTTF